MGKANLKILAEAWLQIIENYCADFQEPYPPTEVLKDITLDIKHGEFLTLLAARC